MFFSKVATLFTATVCLALSSYAFGAEKANIKICSDVATDNLLFPAYGITVPKGWKCRAVAPDAKSPIDLIVWDKGGKRFLIGENSLSLSDIKNELKGIPGLDVKEPQRTIRLFVEAFLADKQVIHTLIAKQFSDQFIKLPRAILFSKNNDLTVIYGNQGEKEHKGKQQDFQTAIFLKKDGGSKELSVGCYGCTPDEFFSLVVNPVIQK
jgi:hypothetical protein